MFVVCKVEWHAVYVKRMESYLIRMVVYPNVLTILAKFKSLESDLGEFGAHSCLYCC